MPTAARAKPMIIAQARRQRQRLFRAIPACRVRKLAEHGERVGLGLFGRLEIRRRPPTAGRRSGQTSWRGVTGISISSSSSISACRSKSRLGDQHVLVGLLVLGRGGVLVGDEAEPAIDRQRQSRPAPGSAGRPAAPRPRPPGAARAPAAPVGAGALLAVGRPSRPAASAAGVGQFGGQARVSSSTGRCRTGSPRPRQRRSRRAGRGRILWSFAASLNRSPHNHGPCNAP